MEALILFLALGVLLVAVAGPALALAAFSRASGLRAQVEALAARVAALERGAGVPPPAAAPAPAPVRAPEPRVEPATTVAPPPAVVAPARAAAADAAFIPPPAPRPDFATNLGPKILVAAGALAFVVFLGLFVKYAWESNWVGPTGRVLFGAAMGLALVAGGVRLVGREYRPLGQGLAGAGLAGLYVSAFGAHGLYGLIPREAAGALMVAITVNAVLLAMRLDARLLATLAWVGGYLTPLLLSTGEDKTVALFAYLALLDVGALVLDRRKPWPETVPLAMLGTAVLYAGWYDRFYRADRFEVAAAGLVIFTALFALRSLAGGRPPTWLLDGLALLGGGVGAIALAADTDRPALLLALLLALAGVAALLRRRWTWSEAAIAACSALAVLSWFDRFYRPERADEALTLALTVSGVHLVTVLSRAWLTRQRIGAAGLATHLVAAALAWTVLYRVLDPARASLLGFAALGLAVLYLALGLVGLRERREDTSHARVLLALATAFLTLAIPVQLGLHGITLAWALEGLLLLVLGVRFGSALARVAGYGVLGLAVLRLFARHLPLHAVAFQPFLNPALGTWLAVILLLGAAVRVARTVGKPETTFDLGLRAICAMAAVVLLFGLLTAETQAMFTQRATLARAAGDEAAAETSRLAGGLAVSVLWTAFATALLAAGLGLRSRGLFYSGYALFALTAAKVVLWDLATLQTLYRMLSFLALGALLLAGAYLNLRFRQRLLPETATS